MEDQQNTSQNLSKTPQNSSFQNIPQLPPNLARKRNSIPNLGSINNLFNNSTSQNNVNGKRYIRKKRKFLFWSWTVKVLSDDDKYADQSVKSDSSLISKLRKKCKEHEI